MTPSKEQIQEAIERINRSVIKNYNETPFKFSAISTEDIQTLISLASQYLERGFGLTEEEALKVVKETTNCYCYINDTCDVTNEDIAKALVAKQRVVK